MPTYVLRNNKSGEEYEVNCSYSDLEDYLAHPDIQQVIKAPSMITQHGSTIGKTSEGWRDLLKSIKKGSGKGNTINT